MTKKKIPQTIEECNAELERTQKLLQQYENRNKMLNRKLSVEKRKERNHRIFLFGGFMESIVPELKTMTEDEGKDFLYHIAKSTEAQEYLKKRAEGMDCKFRVQSSTCTGNEPHSHGDLAPPSRVRGPR